MSADPHFRHVDRQGAVPHKTEPGSAVLVPFGPYGAGQMTGHPIGLVIVVGTLLMGLVSRTPVAFLLLASFVPGCIWGLVLWLRHARENTGAGTTQTFLKI